MGSANGNAGCRTQRLCSGLTLIEALVVLTVVSMLVSLAIGGWQDFFQKQRLHGHAELYRSHFQWARSEAVARNRSVVVRVKNSDSTGGCYLFYLGPVNACSCTATHAECTPEGELVASVVMPPDEGIQVRKLSNTPVAHIDPTRGTLSPTQSVAFSDTKGREIRLISALTGRIRACGVNLPTALPHC